MPNQHLQGLAAYLIDRTDDVLRSWRSRVDADARLVTASHLRRVEFEDNITQSLLQLAQHLRELAMESGPVDPEELADRVEEKERGHSAEHGQHRWEVGYDLRELVLEYGHLHFCLLEVIDQYEAGFPDADRNFSQKSRFAVAAFANTGYSESVSEFYRLQQAEAREVARDLTEALRQMDVWQRQRGQLLREAVHDLRGNLAAVRAATEVLTSLPPEAVDMTSDDQRLLLDMLRRGAQSQYDMLSDLLDLSRLESGEEVREEKEFDAAGLLKSLCDVMQPLAQARQLYLTCTGPDSLAVQGDAIKVNRIAQNLVLNGLKYTTKGGVIVGWDSSGSRWSFSVGDTGPGLPSRETSSGPSPGTAQNQFSGTDSREVLPPGEGVGMVVVKRLCNLLDARLNVDSGSAEGTKVTVTLPISYADFGAVHQ